MKRLITATAILLACMGFCHTVLAGDIDSPAVPNDTAGAMYTTDDIYNRLNNGAAGVKRTTPFAEPAAGPGPTGHTLNDAMGIAPVKDNANAAGPEDVKEGKTFWGLKDGVWGLQTGTKKSGPYLSISDTAVKDPGAGTTTPMEFIVTLSDAGGVPITVDYATADVTATAGADYTTVGTTELTFAVGETAKTLTIEILGDADTGEPVETFTVQLTNAANADIADDTGEGIISDTATCPQTCIPGKTCVAGEGQTLNISCPSGVIRILWASYGTPVGKCPNFRTGSCHAANSLQIVKNECEGKANCSVYSHADTFGMPCDPAVQKALWVEYICH